jgi:hypothetical protein
MKRVCSPSASRLVSCPHHVTFSAPSTVLESRPTLCVGFSFVPAVLPSDPVSVPRGIVRMHRRWSVRSGHLVHGWCLECQHSSTLIDGPPTDRPIFFQNDAYKRTFGYPGSNAQGAIVATMPAGSFFGAILVTKLADVLGRRPTIMASAWIWVIGSILQCASQNRGMLVAGRVISGVSIGLASSCVPLYQSEITNHNIRGRVVSLQQWAITW